MLDMHRAVPYLFTRGRESMQIGVYGVLISAVRPWPDRRGSDDPSLNAHITHPQPTRNAALSSNFTREAGWKYEA